MRKAVDRAKSVLPPDPAKILDALPLAVADCIAFASAARAFFKEIINKSTPHRISNIEPYDNDDYPPREYWNSNGST